MKPTTKRTLALVALFLYLSGYALARQTHLLIHRVSYSGDSYFHSVRQGDFVGFSSNALPAAICHWIFLPLRFGESLGWHLLYLGKMPKDIP